LGEDQKSKTPPCSLGKIVPLGIRIPSTATRWPEYGKCTV
jgi:hypothetical protein